MASHIRATWKETSDWIFTTGDNHTTAEAVEFHNLGAQDYYVDMNTDLNYFETGIVAQFGTLSCLSLYMHNKDGKFAGFSRTAIRGNRGWLGGICLAPEFRGRGGGSLLFEEYVNLLRERASIKTLQFECIAQNTRALTMYGKFGCEIKGDLITYTTELQDFEPAPGGLTMTTSDRIDLRSPWLQHTTNYPWQREFSVLLAGPHEQYRFTLDGEVVLELAVDATRNPVRIDGIAYQQRPTPERLTEAIRMMSKSLSKTKFRVSNEPSDSDVTPLLEAVLKREELYQKALVLRMDHK